MDEDRIDALEQRVRELEHRVDGILDRIGYMPGDTPLIRDDAHWDVDADLVALARSGKPKDLTKAVYEHIKRTGAEPETAKQAVERAIGA